MAIPSYNRNIWFINKIIKFFKYLYEKYIYIYNLLKYVKMSIYSHKCTI